MAEWFEVFEPEPDRHPLGRSLSTCQRATRPRRAAQAAREARNAARVQHLSAPYILLYAELMSSKILDLLQLVARRGDVAITMPRPRPRAAPAGRGTGCIPA